MALENLKQNLETEKKIAGEILIFNSQLENLNRLYPHEKKEEKKLLTQTLNLLTEQLKIINNAIPEILNAVTIFKKIPEEKKAEKVRGLTKLSVKPKAETKEISVTIKESEREKFLEKLRLSEGTLKRLKWKEKKEKKEEFMEFKKANIYARLSNRFFFNLANHFINKGRFKKLNLKLRKANMSYLLGTYLSMTFFSALLAFLAGLFYFIFSLFFSIAPSYPFVERASISIGYLAKNFSVLLGLPLATFVSFYLYPSAEARSIESKINQELPFVAIHMSAIAGSGIEPTQIFKIIARGEEYPNTKKEVKKIINQVNVYGYDIVTALKNTARETSSRKWSELLNGTATTISGGGSLTSFLNKRAESLLFDYRLEREKYNKTSETFMDIYIGIVIAAPMIMTLLLVLMNVGQMSIGFSMNILALIMVLIISLINLIFLIFLHLSQPSY
jgi:pilus assembly protein TadC